MDESETGTDKSRDAFGLTGIAARPLARVPVRHRESSVTTAAWRLEVTCDQGDGGIVRVEVPAATPSSAAPSGGEQAFYRGDGIFLGWSQERLAEVYDELTRPPEGGHDRFELLQLG